LDSSDLIATKITPVLLELRKPLWMFFPLVDSESNGPDVWQWSLALSNDRLPVQELLDFISPLCSLKLVVCNKD
jgi:hypothetical protein